MTHHIDLATIHLDKGATSSQGRLPMDREAAAIVDGPERVQA